MRDWRTVPVREGIYSFSHLVDKESGSGEGCVEYQVVIVHFFFFKLSLEISKLACADGWHFVLLETRDNIL